MAKIVLKVILVLAVLLVAFNYFFGTEEEQESSKKIFGQVKQLSGSVVDLLKSEKEKFDEGKYSDALAKVKSVLKLEHEKAEAMRSAAGDKCLETCRHLEEKEQELEEKLDAVVQDTGLSVEERDEAIDRLRDEILKLTMDAEGLARDLDSARG